MGAANTDAATSSTANATEIVRLYDAGDATNVGLPTTSSIECRQ